MLHHSVHFASLGPFSKENEIDLNKVLDREVKMINNANSRLLSRMFKNVREDMSSPYESLLFHIMFR